MEKFLNELPQEFAANKTVEFLATPGFCYHQVDIGKATAGALAVHFDFGTGYKLVETVDATDNTIPVTAFGRVKSIKIVPDSVSAGGFSVAYAAGRA